MIPVKAFLQEECGNIRRQLTDALRHDYGHEGSKEFYEECLVRLSHTESVLAQTLDTELSKLGSLQAELSALSGLISRIERSAYGEFSWPFAEELKEIALVLCTENTLMGQLPPVIHIFSEGGLGAYAIWAEPNRPTASLRKILTVVFPTTLKHSVLLHPILGHEVGHAIVAVPKHQATLNNLLKTTILSGGPMSSPQNVDAWLFSGNAPAGIQTILAKKGWHAPHTNKRIFSSWIEEFLCDFVGVVLFGPTFIASLLSLLRGVFPDGFSVGLEHPPVLARLNAVLEAAKQLKLDDTSQLTGQSRAAADKFWTDAMAQRFNDPWADVFTPTQISDLLLGLKALVSVSPRAHYVGPADPAQFERQYQTIIKGVPPVDSLVTVAGEVKNAHVDFRDTLYAGWLAHTAKVAGLNFHTINRLCDLGILQQRALKTFGAP